MPGQPGRPGGGFGFDLGDLFGGSGGRPAERRQRRPRRHLRRHVRRRRPGRHQQTRPRRGADVETEASLSFGDAIDGATVPLQLAGDGPVPGLPRHRGQGRHRAQGLPDLRRHRAGQPEPGHLRLLRALQDCRGRGLVVDDPCTGLHGQRPGDQHPDHPGAHPGRGGRRAADQLKGKGAPGERGGPAGDLYVRVHVTPHPVFGRSGRQPDRDRAGHLRRGGAGRDIKVPSHRGPAGHGEDPGGHAQRPDVPGPRQGCPAVRRDLRRPAGHRRACRCPSRRSSGEATREALEKLAASADRGKAPDPRDGRCCSRAKAG